MADGLVQQDARPARPQHHGNLAGRRRLRAQVDQSLAQGLVGRRPPGGGLQVAVVEDPPAGAEAARLAVATVVDHHRDIEAHQRPHVAHPVAAGAHDLHRLPLAAERGHDLEDAVVLAPRIGVDVGEEFHLGLEVDAAQGVVVGVKGAVGAGGGGAEDAAVAGAHRLHGTGGAADGGFAEIRGVGVAGGLAGDGAQAEPLGGVEAGALEPTVVEDQPLRLAIFEEQLALVGAVERVGDGALDGVAPQAGALEEQFIGDGEVGHGGSSLLGAECLNIGDSPPPYTPDEPPPRHLFLTFGRRAIISGVTW